jgi:hypothetical protein
MAVITTETRAQIDDTLLARLRAIARRGLARMYVPRAQMFCFCIRRSATGEAREGLSRRYTAIALLGLAQETDTTVREILGGETAATVCGRLLGDVAQVSNLGDVALTLWAGQALGVAARTAAYERLREIAPLEGPQSTVELSWTLTALTLADGLPGAAELRDMVAARLLSAFEPRAGLFRHTVGGGRGLRGHVACFADLVYPIHALAHYYRATGDEAAFAVARQCGAQMCALQGAAGQWWWHYDVRTGAVIEGYPVYAVHQDAMAPLALRALADAGGADASAALTRGLRWLEHSPELNGQTLIDDRAGLVWRKVARREPAKLTRRAKAVASAVHPALRVPGADTFFPPVAVDWESRPYHLGWILYAWSPVRQALSGRTESERAS